MEPLAFRQRRYVSEALGNERNIWLQEPATPGPAELLLFLDGEYFLTHLEAPATVRALQESGALPPCWVAYVAAREREVRWPENFCSRVFARAVCDELVPQIESWVGVAPTGRALAGLSLTGLGAVYIALSAPARFQRVLSLSGSFWWGDGRLARELSSFPAGSTRFRLTVGDRETCTDVDHGHGLIQRISQVEGCRNMRDGLRDRGFMVSYAEYAGGHDVPSWRRDLAGDLRILFADTPGTIALRRATLADATEVSTLFARVRREALPYLPVTHTPEEDRAYFNKVVLAQQSVWLAERRDRLVGFIAYDETCLHHLYVDLRSHGIGQRLLAKAEADCTQLQLWTFQRNVGARRFYARYGFKEVEQTDGTTNEEREPDVRMEWRR